LQLPQKPLTEQEQFLSLDLQLLAFPMMFLSGSAIPLEVLPHTVRRVAEFIPLTHVVTLMRGLWAGDAWGQHVTETIVLLATLVIGAAVSAKAFRWE